MYGRLTDRAQKVMALANQEAQRFNHEYIGTEHILLGLVKEGSGTGAKVLKNFGVDLRRVRLEVQKLIKSGLKMVVMGKLPQTPQAEKVVECAIDESRNLNHNYVGTEHLLLGLIREHNGVAAHVLVNLGLNLKDVRDEIVDTLGQGTVHNDARLTGSSANPDKNNPTVDDAGSLERVLVGLRGGPDEAQLVIAQGNEKLAKALKDASLPSEPRLIVGRTFCFCPNIRKDGRETIAPFWSIIGSVSLSQTGYLEIFPVVGMLIDGHLHDRIRREGDDWYFPTKASFVHVGHLKIL